MSDGRQRFFLALSYLWMAVVIGYMLWGAFNYTGLYRWLAEWQVEQWGGYYKKWTAALPAILLCLPAISWHRSRTRGAARRRKRMTRRRRRGRSGGRRAGRC